MSERTIKRALISVYDKTGIVDFARALVDEFGIEVISTGGTARLLKENGIPVTLVEDITGFPELLDGRVKTLHPKIHAAILADRDNPAQMKQLAEQGIEPIDMVVVNLYPFEETVKRADCTFEEAIEMIDIGGPCLLRAAAKNHRHVTIVATPTLYRRVLTTLRGDEDAKPESLAGIAFSTTMLYDAGIVNWVRRGEASMPMRADVRWHTDRLRYGENPHQAGERYANLEAPAESTSFGHANPSELSFNNIVDADAAVELCKEIHRELGAGSNKHTAVFVKHNNACGVGMSADAEEACRLAYLGDANAAMGGILACSFPIEPSSATVVMNTYDRWGRSAGAGGFFVEVWIAPDFTDEAIDVIRKEKPWGQRVRLLKAGDLGRSPVEHETSKYITGGMLVQTRDLVGLNEDQWKVATKRAATDREMNDLRLAWLVAKHTKSNAISICKDGMLIGNGAGQMSRVMSCRIATWLANENGHEEKLKGAVAASDAFFPFRDGSDLLMDAGVTAIIQPGGSKRDEETIRACDERGVAMIFTGTRHFKH